MDKLLTKNDHEEKYFCLDSDGIKKIPWTLLEKYQKDNTKIENVYNTWWIIEVLYVHRESCIH